MGGGCLKNLFCLLLWKNYILTKRHWIVTPLEVLIIPIVSILIIVLMSSGGGPGPEGDEVTTTDSKGNSRYQGFDPRDPANTSVEQPLKSIILYAPDSPEVTAIMGMVQAQFAAPTQAATPSPLSTYNFRSYADESSLLKDFAENADFNGRKHPITESLTNPVLAAITFGTTSDDEISYRIRFPAGTVKWMTNLVFPEMPQDKERDWKNEHGGRPKYWNNGFLFLQSSVDHAIIQQRTGTGQMSEFNVTLARFPYPKAKVEDKSVMMVLLPMALVQSFFYPVANIAKAIVWEKEKRLKESMKMMGLPGWLHWMAWLTKSFILLSFTVALITLLLSILVLTKADGSVVFFFLLAYEFSAITFGFLVGSFCSKANKAAILACIIFFATFIPYMQLIGRNYNKASAGAKIGWSFLNNCGMGIGCKIVVLFEGTGAGIQWNNIAQTATPDDNITLLSIMGMLLLDGFVYLFLAMYIEAVFPGEFGVPLPWYFPCVPCFWFGARNKVHPDSSPTNNTDGFFEKEPEHAAIGIQIIGLRKVFGKKVAVDGLELNFYENQVTALLGHNGAGKTTTMSMLTGLFPPTSGTALVNGFDIRTDMRSVRKSLGLCPQHDVLFDELTVEEHLKFFCLLKGYDKPVQPEVDKMLVALYLEDKRKAQSKTLSGGMKRKLSVGIAFVGESKVVLLDEPTAGMDPWARRGVWDIISKQKHGRTILLSTHFMDEADLLGDRIAILANGKVACCGSPLFLKQKYGGGYHLIIVKEPNCKVDLITELLQKYIPEVKVDQNIGTELSYSLPEGKASVFPEMFEDLEKKKAELGISSYGCCITQMEEVFMRVGEQLDNELKQKSKQKNASVHPSTNPIQLSSADMEQSGSRKSSSKVAGEQEVTTDEINSGSVSQLPSEDGIKIEEPPPITTQYTRNKGCSLFLQQFRAMFVKKCIYSMRNWILLTFLALLTVTFFALVLWSASQGPESLKNEVEMSLDLKRFDKPITTVECLESTARSMDICRVYEGVAQSQSTVETTGTLKFEDFILAKAGKDNADQPEVNFRHIVGLQVEEPTQSQTTQKLKLKGYFNGQPYHAPPIALNLISNSILRTVTNNPGFTLTVSNYPLPYREDEKADEAVRKGGGGVNHIALLIITSLFMASFIMFPVKERAGQAKHLQFVSGAQYPVFWLGHLTFDGLFYLLVCILMLVVAAIFQAEPLTTGSALFAFFLILFLYGWAVMPVAYIFSLLFSSPATGYTIVFTLYILSGWGFGTIAMNSAQGMGAVTVIFDLIPTCGLYTSIIILGSSLEGCKECGIGNLLGFEPGELPPLGYKLVVLFLDGFIYFGLLCLVESRLLRCACGCCKNKPVMNAEDPTMLEDSDVAAETQRIRGTDLKQLFETDNMVLKDLTKCYKKLLAVDKLCLGVQHGECFGLLGVNGAGKTTTFKMLTGDIQITSGDAYITGNSVKAKLKEVHKVIGYCPQFDAIIPELTGKETIRMFARLRGIPETEINGLIDRFAADLLFAEHISKPCGTYSGGNKRKLSAAIALIGNPPMVFLDEPTAGLDPLARRYLWNTVIKVREAGVSVILTSHSMDECEALCTRLAIMVNGKFRCLGSTQHLKNKFGDGFTIIAQLPAAPNELPELKRSSLASSFPFRLKETGRRRASLVGPAEPWETHLQPLREFIESNFKDCELKDMHPCYVHYHIKMNADTLSWPQLFRKMEEAKQLFELEAYSVGQTSLEQVFLGFAKGQWNADG